LLALLLDRKRLDLKACAAAMAPFALGAVALAIYVHPHWNEAYEQFGWNASYTDAGGVGRLSGWKHPLAAWERVAGFVMREFAPVEGTGWAAWIKMLIPLTYAVALALAISIARVRRMPGLLVLMAVASANCLLLPLLAGYLKWQYYLHILVLFPPVVVLVFVALWRERASASALFAGFAVLTGAVVLLQSARIVHSLDENSLALRYQPSATRLRQPPFDKGTFWGKSYWAYAVGLDRLTEDSDFGYFSQKRKDFVILTLDQTNKKGDMPAGYLGDYLRSLLTQEYALAYEDQAIRVYARRLSE
jgi:hypothetical protein